MWVPFEAWQKYRVTDVATVEEFVRRYYKADRITHMLRDYPDYFDILVQSRNKDIAEDGVTIISHHDSVTGQVVSFYPPTP